jgi:hypothetical protein
MIYANAAIQRMVVLIFLYIKSGYRLLLLGIQKGLFAAYFFYLVQRESCASRLVSARII